MIKRIRANITKSRYESPVRAFLRERLELMVDCFGENDVGHEAVASTVSSGGTSLYTFLSSKDLLPGGVRGI